MENNNNNLTQVQQEVKEYYGQTLQSSKDLATNACCLGSVGYTASQKAVLKKIHPDVINKFYGCGSPVPEAVEGITLIDLGCGSGRDCYLASGLVGENGRVIGIDMTEEQLETARKYVDYHTQAFGYSKPNVQFVNGTLENLTSSGIQDESVDVVISNCVLNLCQDKKVALKEIWKVLKWGGELYFSDVYADRRIPEHLQKDKVLWGECLSGALYLEDFRRMMQSIGFLDYRIVKQSNITIDNKQIEEQLKGIKFYSITIRAFKLRDMEDKCEDYGQTITYNGGLADCQDQFKLDSGHVFKIGEKVRVCGNTASMLSDTRFSKYFSVDKRGEHLGLFDCSSGAGDDNCDSKKCSESGVCC